MVQNGSSSSPLSSVAYPQDFTGPPRYLHPFPYPTHPFTHYSNIQGAIVLSYPEHSKRGRYLAIWLAFKNSGQILGGSINLGLNATRSTGGKVSYTTLLIFVILQVLALPAAFLIVNPEKVRREDGTKVVVDEKTTTGEQVRTLGRICASRKIGFLLPIFCSSPFASFLLHPFPHLYLVNSLLMVLLGLVLHLPHTLLHRPRPRTRVPSLRHHRSHRYNYPRVLPRLSTLFHSSTSEIWRGIYIHIVFWYSRVGYGGGTFLSSSKSR